jgi:hypothetical protein
LFLQSKLYRNKSISSVVEWENNFVGLDVDEMWAFFKTTLLELIDKYVPKSKAKRQRRCMWMNWKTRKAIKSHNRRWKKYKVSKDYGDFLSYKSARNRAVKAVKIAKKKFERKLAKNIKKRFVKFLRLCEVKSKD